MDDPNITMEEYIRLEEEKAQNRGKVFNWETAKYGKIWYDEEIYDLRSIETEFPAIAFNGGVSSEKTLSCEPTVSSLNDEIDFRISFDDSDDKDYTVMFDKNLFSYKIISTNNLKMESENDDEKVNIPSFLPPEPTVSCFDDLDFFKDFENEFPTIIYNDAPTSKSYLLTELTLNPKNIDEFDLKDETSLSEYDEEEQNVLYFNDLFPFNIIQPDDLKSKKDNDDNEVDIIQSSEECLKSYYLCTILVDFTDMALLPRDQRNQYLRFREVVLDLDTAGALQFQLGGARHHLSLRDPILRMCHSLIASSIARRSQAPEKVTVTDLFYLRGMDVGSVNIPYLLARLLTEERLRGLIVIALALPVIDMAKLVRLQICVEIDDTWDWVAMGPGRQPDATVGAPRVAQDGPILDEGDQAVPTPVQALPPPAAAARTMPQRMARLEEDLHEIRGALAE
ncbi:hypothetical protein Tco_0697091 [Tanacetum coccineum]